MLCLHMETLCEKRFGKFKCKFCKERFEVKNNCLDHLRSCLKNKNRLRCVRCNAKAESDELETLRIHESRCKDVYLFAKKYSAQYSRCSMTEYCRYGCNSKSKLLHHIKTLHASRYCGVCGEIFVTTNAKQKHVLHSHPNNKFKCGLCKDQYAKKHELLRHRHNTHRCNVRVRHSAGNNHRCPRCRRLFAQKQCLDRHVRSFKNKSKHIICKKKKQWALPHMYPKLNYWGICNHNPIAAGPINVLLYILCRLVDYVETSCVWFCSVCSRFVID